MKRKIIIIITLLSIACIHAWGQSNTDIKSVFDKYGKQQGVVFVQLSHDILSQGSNISVYKSMTIKESKEIKTKEISRQLLNNKNDWKTISEVQKNGVVESGSYNLGKDESGKLNTFLLLKNKNQKLTILYLEGSFASNHLDRELKSLKDLFIYVNNEKVKLY